MSQIESLSSGNIGGVENEQFMGDIEGFIGEEIEIDPISLLIDELKHEDLATRVNAIHQLPLISNALGVERTRSELIPFLTDTSEEDDEVLLVLAEELGKFADLVGGASHVHLLIEPLGRLVGEEDIHVREKAINSLLNVCSLLTTSQIHELVVPLIVDLSNHQWFPRKQSAAILIATCYIWIKDKDLKENIERLFISLCKDEYPMVRKVAAANLPKLVKHLSNEVILSDFLPCITGRIAVDEIDIVRLMAVDCIIAVGQIMSPSQLRSLLWNTLAGSDESPENAGLLKDKSWRIRYIVADKFPQLFQLFRPIFDKENAEEIHEYLPPLISYYTAYGYDAEGEVRCACCTRLVEMFLLLKEEENECVNWLLPLTKSFAIDSNQLVKAALADQISAICAIIGEELADKYALLDLYSVLLKDDGNADVRLNVISHLDQLSGVVGMDRIVEALMPALATLSIDKQWRVRQALVEFIPLVAKRLGLDFFDANLNQYLFKALGDHVYAVREIAIESMKQLIEIFGSEWASSRLIKHLHSLGNNSNYLMRATAVIAIGKIGGCFEREVLFDSLIPFVLEYVKDPVPNIRLNVAKCIDMLNPLIKSHLKSTSSAHQMMEDVQFTSSDESIESTFFSQQLLPTLQLLQQDKDVDVRYFAQMAFDHAQELK